MSDPLGDVVVNGNRFAIRKADASLHGTFVAPAKAEVTATINEVRTVLRKGESVLKIPSILARGGDAFFLVATLQGAETTPPEIKITGAGLDAAAIEALIGGYPQAAP